ncbi:cbl-interacting protein kinase 13 [Hordeum vulgare]|nr:cbl-interacting protein kinase 13 [Hordeum vulgare]
MANGALETANAAVDTAALETGEPAKTTVALETGEALKTMVALETGEVDAKKDCCSDNSVALVANLEARCPPLAIERFRGLSHAMNGVTFLMNYLLAVEEKCCYLEWIDPEWSVAMQFCIGQLWSMHDKENEDKIRENLKLGEENFKIIVEKRKMEEEVRFLKVDFAKMVAEKEEAINQLGSARLAISDLKEEIEKKKLADHSCTNLHQVPRAKAKERDQLVLEREQMKEEKKKLEYIICDMMKQNHGYKDKVKKLMEICDEF